MYYARKTLDEAQMSYSIVKKKMLAMVFAVEQFFQYLLGSKVVVFTYWSILSQALGGEEWCQAKVN